MSIVSFYGQGESAGNIAKYPKNPSFQGESAGSIAKCPKQQKALQTLSSDTVNFKGRDKEKKSSFLGTVLTLATTAGVVLGSLTYAHKSGSIAKLKDGSIKKHLSKASETCYDWYNKTKDFGEKYYNKIKNYINKKS